MRIRNRFALSTTALVGLMACDPRVAENPTQPDIIVPDGALGSEKIERIGDACYAETFRQPDEQRTDKLDLLFVVDTSASLLFERGVVAHRIDHFIKELPANTHYRISVLLAHGKRSKWSGRNYYDGLLSPAVFDSQKHSPMWIRLNLSLRLQVLPMDYWSDGGEASFYSLNKALEGESLDRFKKQGFFRDDAALSVVFIGDESELCYQYPEGVVPRRDFDSFEGRTLESLAREENCQVQDSQGNTQWLSAQYMHDRLRDFKGAQPVSVAAIVHTQKELKNLLPRAEDEYGYGYADLVALNKGELVNIRDKDYTEGLERIGRAAAASMTVYNKFALTHTNIDVASLSVEVDSRARSEFAWLADEGSVFVKEPGQAHSVVEINYCLAAADGGGGVEIPDVEDPEEDTDNEVPDGDESQTPDDGEPGDGSDLPGGCNAVECADIGL